MLSRINLPMKTLRELGRIKDAVRSISEMYSRSASQFFRKGRSGTVTSSSRSTSRCGMGVFAMTTATTSFSAPARPCPWARWRTQSVRSSAARTSSSAERLKFSTSSSERHATLGNARTASSRRIVNAYAIIIALMQLRTDPSQSCSIDFSNACTGAS